jgi:hypothetical protein
MSTVGPPNLTPESADYLWDPAAAPDPEIQRLETLLSVYRHRRPAPELPAPQPISITPVVRARPGRALLAAAAMILLAAAAAIIAHRPAPAWDVTALAGSPQIGSLAVIGAGSLPAGQWLRTDASSSARLDVPGLGQVEVKPRSLVRIAPGAGLQRRLQLREGSLYARISAPPRLFIVDTPSAQAVDMGCEYRLEVDSEGAGTLWVLLGWVYLQDGGVESRVPMAGGMCRIDPRRGPGTPYYEDASPAFVDALARFDFGDGGRAALQTVLAQARPHDSLSLWHLLSRTQGRDRAAVLDRLAALKDIPTTLPRERILAIDPAVIDRLWEELRPF